jgi:cytochrome c-type biogenesis protein
MGESAPSAYLAFVAGLLSVLSPCVLPLMPAYLSLISGISVDELQEGRDDAALRQRVMRACLGFVAGFSAVFILMGVGAVAAGHILRTWRAELFGVEFGVTQIAGVFIILLGLHMTGISPIRALYRDTRFQFSLRRRSFLSSLLVGVGFALGWSPCIGPILATILTVAGHRETVLQGVALPWSIEYFFEAFDRIKLHFRKLEIASGLILMGVGVLLVTGQLSRFNDSFTFMTDFISAAERALQ